VSETGIAGNIAALNIPEGVLLVAVTKGVPPERIGEAIRAGVKAVGENRVQEAEKKGIAGIRGAEKHFIGKLQSNKVGKAVEIFDVIESVDSLRLAEKISGEAAKRGKIMRVFLEVNVSGELKKGGVKPAEVAPLLREMRALSSLSVEGLMCVASRENPRRDFRLLKKLFDESRGLRFLSMGMTDDYKVALEEGANAVRVGRGVFGERF